MSPDKEKLYIIVLTCVGLCAMISIFIVIGVVRALWRQRKADEDYEDNKTKTIPPGIRNPPSVKPVVKSVFPQSSSVDASAKTSPVNMNLQSQSGSNADQPPHLEVMNDSGRNMATSAQLYHYQHQKLIRGERKTLDSGDYSEEEEHRTATPDVKEKSYAGPASDWGNNRKATDMQQDIEVPNPFYMEELRVNHSMDASTK